MEFRPWLNCCDWRRRLQPELWPAMSQPLPIAPYDVYALHDWDRLNAAIREQHGDGALDRGPFSISSLLTSLSVTSQAFIVNKETERGFFFNLLFIFFLILYEKFCKTENPNHRLSSIQFPDGRWIPTFLHYFREWILSLELKMIPEKRHRNLIIEVFPICHLHEFHEWHPQPTAIHIRPRHMAGKADALIHGCARCFALEIK